ncbi:MAG: Ig-like domain-containing protein, partial [Limisphaerales bacterium]
MKRNLIVLSALLISLNSGLGQSNTLQITSVETGTDKGITLRWKSLSNVVYRIDYTPELSDNINWQPLYENYPSHGTNTYWKDTGDKDSSPVVKHPQDDAMRFYRLVETGTNVESQPQVGIISPASGATLSGNISVSVSVASSLDVFSIRLFVDGQEVGNQFYPSTNFVINTCQFGNGLHNIFAVAENTSGAETTDEPSNLVLNFAASPYRSVTFNNYIMDFRGSAHFLEPADSETIRYRANFSGYSDWTLVITNSSGVAVRTVTGLSYGMDFLWNGTDDGGLTVPVDFYSPTLTATQSSMSPQSNSEASSLPSAAISAIAAGQSSYFVQQPPLPPPLEKLIGPLPPIEIKISELYLKGEFPQTPASNNSFDFFLDGPDPASPQTTTLIPPQVVGAMGTIGVAYQGNHPSIAFPANTAPANGIGGRVRLNTIGSGSFGSLHAIPPIKVGFKVIMAKAGYRLKYEAINGGLLASDLRSPSRGGTSRFNDVNLGFLIGHGVYGTTPDYTISASGPLQSYYPVYHRGDSS